MIRMMWECKGCGKNAPCRLVELFEHMPELDPNDCPRGIANAEWKKCGECVVPYAVDELDTENPDVDRNKTKILFKKLNPRAVAPKRAHEGDAGWDITSVGRTLQNGFAVYYSGLAFAIPKGLAILAIPRSSIYKKDLVLTNSVGLIDSGYRGEVKGVFKVVGNYCNIYDVDERFCQLVVIGGGARMNDVEFVEVDELPESWDGRNGDGFGSTGIK